MELIDIKANKVFQYLASGQIQILSLDIFDTILYRLVPRPIDAFIMLGHRLISKGLIPLQTSPDVFAKYRINAESRARQKQHQQSNSMEVSLEEIYRCFPKALRDKIPIQNFIEEEVELESQITCFDPTIEHIVNYAKDSNIKVILTSDTYFSKSALKKILGDFYNKVDHIFNSCDHRTPKANKLFDVVLKKTEYPAASILHIGDKHEADIEPALSRNMHAVHWLSENAFFEDILEKEISEYVSDRAQIFDPQYGDFGLSAVRRRVLYHPDIGFPSPVDMQENQNIEDEVIYKIYGAQIMGPILTSFCQWVYQSCQEQGATDLLCLMREGRLFKQMMDSLTEGEEHPLTSHEIFVSRYATLKSSILYGNTEEIFEFINRPGQITIREANKDLGLNDEDFKNYADNLDQPLDHEHHIRQYIHYISTRPKLKQKILDDSKRHRDNFMKHLGSKVDLENITKVFLIDIGYAGSIQKKMEKIIKSYYPNIQTVGYYLLTNERIETVLMNGAHAKGFLTDGGQPTSVSHLVSRSPEVLEQCTMADCGSTKGYDDQGAPILGELTIPEKQKQEIKWVQSGILTFTKIWKAHTQNNLADLDPHHMKQIVRNIIVRSVAEPSLLETSYFGRWYHDDNLTNEQSRKLIDYENIAKDIPYFSAHQLASVKSKDAYWIFAIAGIISPILQKAIKHIFMREVNPENFGAPEQDHKFLLSFDCGQGYNEKTSVYSPYKRSANGCVRHRVSTKIVDKDIHSLAAFFINTNDVFQFDSITITMTSQKGKVETYNFSQQDGSFEENFTIKGFEKLKNGLYTSHAEEALLIWKPNNIIKKFSGKIFFDLYFSTLKILSHKKVPVENESTRL